MKSLVSILIITALALVGCGKDKGDSGANSNYNQYGCNGYGNGYSGYGNGYSGYGNGYSGYGNGSVGPGGAGIGYYQWQGNRCVDTRRPGTSVNPRLCNNSVNNSYAGNGFGNGCNYGNSGFGNGWSGVGSGFSGGNYNYSGSWNYNFVSGFGTGVCAPGFTPVPMYGFYNQVMCVESSFIPFLYTNYGTPSFPGMYGSYGFQAVGCIPGYSAPCTCRPVGASLTLGAQFGSGYAGLSAGICF